MALRHADWPPEEDLREVCTYCEGDVAEGRCVACGMPRPTGDELVDVELAPKMVAKLEGRGFSHSR